MIPRIGARVKANDLGAVLTCCDKESLVGPKTPSPEPYHARYITSAVIPPTRAAASLLRVLSSTVPQNITPHIMHVTSSHEVTPGDHDIHTTPNIGNEILV